MVNIRVESLKILIFIIIKIRWGIFNFLFYYTYLPNLVRPIYFVCNLSAFLHCYQIATIRSLRPWIHLRILKSKVNNLQRLHRS